MADPTPPAAPPISINAAFHWPKLPTPNLTQVLLAVVIGWMGWDKVIEPYWFGTSNNGTATATDDAAFKLGKEYAKCSTVKIADAIDKTASGRYDTYASWIGAQREAIREGLEEAGDAAGAELEKRTGKRSEEDLQAKISSSDELAIGVFMKSFAKGIRGKR